VKSNGPADRTVRVYFRAPTGLLVDVSERLRGSGGDREELKEMLMKCIAAAARDGHPFTYRGASGVYQNRERLPARFHRVGDKTSRARLDELLEGALSWS